jgi:hypothetical protein
MSRVTRETHPDWLFRAARRFRQHVGRQDKRSSARLSRAGLPQADPCCYLTTGSRGAPTASASRAQWAASCLIPSSVGVNSASSRRLLPRLRQRDIERHDPRLVRPSGVNRVPAEALAPPRDRTRAIRPTRADSAAGQSLDAARRMCVRVRSSGSPWPCQSIRGWPTSVPADGQRWSPLVAR